MQDGQTTVLGTRMDWMIARGFRPVDLTLNRVVDQAPGVKSFYFDYDRAAFQYRASQSLHLHLAFEKDQGMYRSFSIGSSPTEDFLLLTTRIRAGSEYKTKLASLRAGDAAVALGPVGNFTLPEDQSKKVVMVGSWIGITPFRSMIKYATDRKLPNKIVLLYLNPDPDQVIFKRELEDFVSKNPELEISLKFTEREMTTEGQILKGFLREHADALDGSQYYLAGAPSSVQGSLGVLRERGITEIKMEVFQGYERTY